MSMHCKPHCAGFIARFIVFAVVGIAALGWVIMALWNWLIPTLFVGSPEIGYLQAMGILLLSRILFGGFRGHGGHGRWNRDRWARMTPQEREKFQAGMQRCFGKGEAPAAESDH